MRTIAACSLQGERRSTGQPMIFCPATYASWLRSLYQEPFAAQFALEWGVRSAARSGRSNWIAGSHTGLGRGSAGNRQDDGAGTNESPQHFVLPTI